MSTFEDKSMSEAIENRDFEEYYNDSDEFVNFEMEDGEDAYRYRNGGLHPVHIGDLLDGTRYKVLQKLGHGPSSTVWLALDLSLDNKDINAKDVNAKDVNDKDVNGKDINDKKVKNKYVAVKIKESNLSGLPNELDILNHLSNSESRHPGRMYSSASLLLRNFWIHGPNGKHLALVFQVRGPSILRLQMWRSNRLDPCLGRSIALQVTQGLEYLHSEGICQGDLHSSDVLFQLDTWPKDIQDQLGEPKLYPIEPGLGRPDYLVDPACFFGTGSQLLTKNITIVGHSESFFVKSPSDKVRITSHFTAPEVLYGWDASFYSDIWALGCLIYELRAGRLLFWEALLDSPLETVSHIVRTLGNVPSSWDHVRFNEEGFLDQRGCESPVLGFVTLYPLHELVNDIADKQISPPDVNKLEEFDYKKEHALKFWGRTKWNYHIADSSTPLLARAPIKEDMEPSKIPVEESTTLADLLSQILKYEREDRISLGDIATHPWLDSPTFFEVKP